MIGYIIAQCSPSFAKRRSLVYGSGFLGVFLFSCVIGMHIWRSAGRLRHVSSLCNFLFLPFLLSNEAGLVAIWLRPHGRFRLYVTVEAHEGRIDAEAGGVGYSLEDGRSS